MPIIALGVFGPILSGDAAYEYQYGPNWRERVAFDAALFQAGRRLDRRADDAVSAIRAAAGLTPAAEAA